MSMKYQSEYDAQFEQWRDEFFAQFPDRKAEYDAKFESAGSAEWLDYNKAFVSEIFGEMNAKGQQACSDAQANRDAAQVVYDSKSEEIRKLMGTTDLFGNYAENTVGWYDKQLNDSTSVDAQTKSRLENERNELLKQKVGFEDEADKLGRDVGQKNGLYSIRRAESVYAEACCYGNDEDIDAAYEKMADAYISYSSEYIDEDHMTYLMDGHVNGAEDSKFLNDNKAIFDKAEHFREVMGKETAATRYERSKSEPVAISENVKPTEKKEEVVTVSASYDTQESQTVETVAASDKSPELTADEKKAFVEHFDETSAQTKASINSFAAQKQYENDSKIADAYRKELGLDSNEKTENKVNPYTFTKPVRTADMSDEAYDNACAAAEQEHIDKVNNEIADAVIRGEYGCGTQRIEQLTAAGYDYTQVQNCVNAKMNAYTKPQETIAVVSAEPNIADEASKSSEEKTTVTKSEKEIKPSVKKQRSLEEPASGEAEADDSLKRKIGGSKKALSAEAFSESLARIDDKGFGAAIADNPCKTDIVSMKNPTGSEKLSESLSKINDESFGKTLETVDSKPKTKATNLSSRFDSICNDSHISEMALNANVSDKSIQRIQKDSGSYDDT